MADSCMPGLVHSNESLSDNIVWLRGDCSSGHCLPITTVGLNHQDYLSPALLEGECYRDDCIPHPFCISLELELKL